MLPPIWYNWYVCTCTVHMAKCIILMTIIMTCLCTDEVLKMDDLMWLLSKLISVASNWFNFGLFLGIQFHELKTIEKKYAHDCNDCLRETLACWLKRNPTTGQLLKALNTAGESKLSRTLKQSFIQCDHRKGYLYNYL